jgi:predicted deacylase
MAGMRTSPLDGGNLNRSFPGEPYGGPTEQIADYIESELLPQCDFVFDLHSGGSSLIYMPSAMMRRPQSPELLEGGIDMLRTFGAPVIERHSPEGGLCKSGLACYRDKNNIP